MKKILFIIIVFFITNNLTAQQESIRMVYPFMPLAINPADAGSKGLASITGIYRKKPLFQNAGLVSSSQQYFSFDMPIRNESMGIGFLAFNTDRPYGTTSGGISSNLGMVGILSKDFELGRDKHVRIGGNLAVNQFPIRAGSGSSITGTSWGIGGSYSSSNFSVGISIPTINLSDLGWKASTPIYGKIQFLQNLADNNLLKIGSVIRYTKGNFSSEIKTDAYAVFWLQEIIGVGLWYQNTGSEFGDDALLVSAEVPLGHFRVGYSYDFLGKNVNTNLSGSGSTSTTLGSDSSAGFHQIFLRYEIDLGNGKISEFRP
jgi:hypothetical protein